MFKTFFKNKENRIFKNKDGFTLKTSFSVKVILGLITLFILFLLLPRYKTIDAEFEIGSVWAVEDLIAPFSFPIYRDEKDYEAEKKAVIDKVAPIFVEISQNNRIKDTLNDFFRKLDEILLQASVLEKNKDKGIHSEKLADLKDKLPVIFLPEKWDKLYKLYKNDIPGYRGPAYSNIKNSIKQTIIDFSQYWIIDLNKSSISTPVISVKKFNSKQIDIVDIDRVFDKRELLNQLVKRITDFMVDNELVSIVEDISGVFLKENLFYSRELSELEIQSRVEQIPKTIGIVRENERIVSKHDPINKLTKLKLDSYKKVRLEKIGVRDYFLENAGKIITILILLSVYVLFLYYIRSRIYNNNFQLALISLLIILEAVFAHLSLKINIDQPVELIIFLPVASILLTIIFDSRLAFYTTVIICYVVSIVRGGDFVISFILFNASVVSIFSVRDIKNRSQIFRSFFYILLGINISILAISFDRMEEITIILHKLIYGSINAVMSPVIAYGLLIFFEKVFRVTTDLTLLELGDFNHPLLKELSTKAPGTFHHSIIMGNLSETAAEAIGANRILARVGCYYHDIGKILKPEYFVENQLEHKNRHEALNPNISVKIIISHVKEGIELARKYKIPEEVINFIPMHHGTTLVSYFYKKAKGYIDEDKEDISDYIYRYPGPKPQTKETGIVMLADSIEAATRAIEEPTPAKLEDKIDEIIKKRFIEGELDDCELTMKDLTKIKKSFLKILVGIHHQRIKYPDEGPDK